MFRAGWQALAFYFVFGVGIPSVFMEWHKQCLLVNKPKLFNFTPMNGIRVSVSLALILMLSV